MRWNTRWSASTSHPDGSPRASWFGYRLPDIDGAARVYRPRNTRTVHLLGLWDNVSAGVSAFHPEWRFAVHQYTRGGAHLYIDIVRSVDIRPGSIAYVDLYFDVMSHPEGVTEKDEELLARLDPEEAAAARATRDEIRRLMAAGVPALQREGSFWDVPAGALGLPAKKLRRTRAWLEGRS